MWGTVLVVVSSLTAQVTLDATPLLAAGEGALADAVVVRLLDEGFVLLPESPRTPRLLLSLGTDGALVVLDDDTAVVPAGDAAVVAADAGHAALGLLRRARVKPAGFARGAVDIAAVGDAAGLVAAGAMAARSSNVAAARGAARRLCLGVDVVVVDAAVGCAELVGAALPWTLAQRRARTVLLDDAELGDDVDDPWVEAPRAVPRDVVDRGGVVVRGSAAPPVWVRGKLAIGSLARPPSLDPAIAAGVDVGMPSGWFVGAVGLGAVRYRDQVSVLSASGGFGGGHRWRWSSWSTSVALLGGGTGDIVQGSDSVDVVPSLSLFVPVTVSVDLGGGTAVEVLGALRLTDSVVTATRQQRVAWEGGPFAAFVGVGGSIGGGSP